MNAVDTNLVVRYVTGDDARQSSLARKLIDGGPVFVTTSVVLETEWVLCSVYGFSLPEIVEPLRTLAGQPTVTLEQPLVVHTAMTWAEQGMDLADAIHIAASRHCAAFITFDRDLVKSAKDVADLPVQAP
jgi:predicted nucleic-acid-binding protein